MPKPTHTPIHTPAVSQATQDLLAVTQALYNERRCQLTHEQRGRACAALTDAIRACQLGQGADALLHASDALATIGGRS
jgi:hypothetical protein